MQVSTAFAKLSIPNVAISVKGYAILISASPEKNFPGREAFLFTLTPQQSVYLSRVFTECEVTTISPSQLSCGGRYCEQDYNYLIQQHGTLFQLNSMNLELKGNELSIVRSTSQQKQEDAIATLTLTDKQLTIVLRGGYGLRE